MANIIEATAKIVLYTKHKLKDGQHPVKLRLTYDRKHKFYGTKGKHTKEEFADVMDEKKKKHRTTRDTYQALEVKAKKIIESLDDFTFEAFELKFLKTSQKSETNIFEYFETYIAEMEKENRFSSVGTYTACLKSLKEFWTKPELHFKQITVKFLNEYEKAMTDKEYSFSTIGIYLRNLRKLLNDAKRNGKISEAEYPFGVGRYQIPKGNSKKRPLTDYEMKKIYEYETTAGTIADYAKDLFIFSYLANGMNFTDILRLKKNQIESDRFTFIRKKTKASTKTTDNLIVVAINNKIAPILKKYENDSQYVFPFLSNEPDEKSKFRRISQIIKNTNKHIKRIAEACGIKKDVTTYFARHSWAMTALNSEKPTEFIQQGLGHTDPRTTQTYLSGIDFEQKKDFSDGLLK